MMKRVRGITRRAFNLSVAAGILGKRRAMAVGPDVTFAVVPDPQYLALFCGSGYSAITTWIAANVSTVVDGAALNIVGAMGVGDCVQTPNSGGELTNATTAWTILDSAGLPWVTPPGNHDMGTSASDRSFGARSTTAGNLLTTAFQSGFFSATSRAAKSYFGGAYDSTGGNTYIIVGSYLLMALEFFPRTAVLTWAAGVCLAHPTLNVIITTHGYMTDAGAVQPRSSGAWSSGTTYDIGEHATRSGAGFIYQSLQAGNINHTPESSPTWWAQFSPWYDTFYADADNPDDYAMGNAPLSNCGQEMWAGSVGPDPNNGGAITTWTGLKLIPNVQMIICGHYVYASHHSGGGVGPSAPWQWNEQGNTSTSSRAQRVSQFYCNHQNIDNTGGGCPSSSVMGAAVYLIRIKPAAGLIQGYAYATTASKWIGTSGSPLNVSPVKLFEVSYAAVNETNRFVISQ